MTTYSQNVDNVNKMTQAKLDDAIRKFFLIRIYSSYKGNITWHLLTYICKLFPPFKLTIKHQTKKFFLVVHNVFFSHVIFGND